MFQQHSRQLIRIIWLQVILFTVVLGLGRQVFLLQVGDLSILQTLPSDYLDSLIIGLRFDLRVATMAFAPLLLIGLCLSASRYYQGFTKAIPTYSFVIYFLAAGVSIANYYYFKTYNNYFDLFIFGLAEDDTVSVLKSMWIDYPILWSAIASLACAALTTVVIKKALQRSTQWQWSARPWYITTLSIVITIAVYFVLARGSIGTFPLKQYHAYVSDYEVLNKVTPNGFLALSWANSEHKRAAKFHSVSKSEYQNQVQKVLGTTSVIHSTESNQYLENNKPNIVYAMMEGMGLNILIEDNYPTNDLLGALRQPFQDDFVFTRFLSSTGGTMNSIAMMLYHSNINSISHSPVQNVLLSGSVFLPYKKAGYKVIYITGGSPNWRNIKTYFERQGVDEFYSEKDIERVFPESSKYKAAWGMPDEYAFKLAETLLQNTTQPIMMFIQTQTNHTPYQVPSDYSVLPLSVSTTSLAKMARPETEVRKVYETYQYAANALGSFINNIKASPLGENTIISASGDHGIRDYAINAPKDLLTGNGVPFYLYIPKTILANKNYQYEPLRIGSHQDIFPTLYSFSLSNVDYYSLGGRNLLTANTNKPFIGFRGNVTITEQGAFSNSSPHILYPWADEQALTLSTKGVKNTTPDLATDRSLLYSLFINSQVKGFKGE
ncbi:LTA synthase family protein [uncultured Aliivibrio sp.]|uniref:LTA synthase family protein n=1 Tax=uncultured Aliivibrio sp. TaxID=873085 RepID=UPI0026139D2C|nr:alkaline phosphatase family protein [uncultured Aliivibrio sp.]